MSTSSSELRESGHAGVRVPPPLIYVAGFMLGLAADRWRARPTFPRRRRRLSPPARFTRNPMYLVMACLYAGLALAVRLHWSLALLPVVLVLVGRLLTKCPSHRAAAAGKVLRK